MGHRFGDEPLAGLSINRRKGWGALRIVGVNLERERLLRPLDSRGLQRLRGPLIETQSSDENPEALTIGPQRTSSA